MKSLVDQLRIQSSNIVNGTTITPPVTIAGLMLVASNVIEEQHALLEKTRKIAASALAGDGDDGDEAEPAAEAAPPKRRGRKPKAPPSAPLEDAAPATLPGVTT
jgi:hypothetical protein